MPISLPENSPIWLVVLGGVGSLVFLSVGVYRKWKAGEIEDDGILLSRIDKDNVNLREQNAKARSELELMHVLFDDERAKRRRAEDVAEVYYRQLLSERLVPREVNKDG